MESFKRAKTIVEKLQKEGHTAYFAGGWVRDFLMNHPSNDIDIATTASVDQIAALFDKTIAVGAHFGILVVVIDGESFEVATFRADEGYHDGRRPFSVKAASPMEDAQRRDFTINGLFYDPITEQIFDYIDGIKDIRAGIIRAIGSAHARFAEDRLRMIRAVRYASRFSFAIEHETQAAITSHAYALFPSVSIERIWQELSKMDKYPHFEMALCTLYRLGLLVEIFPELKEVSFLYIEKRSFAMKRLDPQTPLMIKLFSLFETPTLAIAERFKLSRKQLDEVKLYLSIGPLLNKVDLPPSKWICLYADPLFLPLLKAALLHYPEEEKERLFSFHAAQKEKLHSAIERHLHKKTLLTAQTLIDLGITPGPLLGQIIQKSEEFAINNQIENAADLLPLLDHFRGDK